jgi:hypothetical protein
LNTIQEELDAEDLPVPVNILGINPPGFEAGNETICDGRDLPWLQETQDDHVWQDWDVTYRDVIILDPKTLKVDVYNLTEHNLAETESRNVLKQKLRNAAAR